MVRSSDRKKRCMSRALCLQENEDEYQIQCKPCFFSLSQPLYASANEVGLICAGSGITPALQIIQYEMENITSTRRLYLVWCNRDIEYVPLRNELQKAIQVLKGRLSVVHLFSRKEVGESSGIEGDSIVDYEIGRFDPEFLLKRVDALPKPVEPVELGGPTSSIVMVCGTWDFEKSARSTLFLHGFPSAAIVKVPG